MEKEFVRNLYRHRFGCIPIIEKDVALHTYNQVIDILAELHETMSIKAKNEYNRGYVDCAKTYQFNKMREPREIWRVLDEINKQVDSAENYFSSAVVKFKGDWNFIDYIKNTNSLAVKINPIKDESLKLTFDWGQLVVEIYYIEEH